MMTITDDENGQCPMTNYEDKNDVIAVYNTTI